LRGKEIHFSESWDTVEMKLIADLEANKSIKKGRDEILLSVADLNVEREQ
jgi:hypothetical protein